MSVNIDNNITNVSVSAPPNGVAVENQITQIGVSTSTTQVTISQVGLPGKDGKDAGKNAIISETAPQNVEEGQLWFNTIDGNLYIRYGDNQIGSWVLASDNVPLDLSNYALLSGSNFFTGNQNIIGVVTTTGSLFVSGSTVQIGNNTLSGNTLLDGNIGISGTSTLTGSFLVSGSTTQIGNNTLIGLTTLTGSIFIAGDFIPQISSSFTLGTLESPWKDIFIQSGSIIIRSDVPGAPAARISNKVGDITIESAGFRLQSGSFIPFEVSETARTIITIPQIPAGDIGAFNIIGNSSGTYQPVTNAGGLIHLTGNDGVASRITSDAYGTTAFAAYVGRKARGTAETPLPVQSNDTLTRISSIGWTGPEYGFTMSSGLTTAPTSLDVIALENFTTSSFGTAYRFFNSPLGNTTRVLSAQIDTDGLIVPNIPTNNTATQVLVWDSVSGRVGKQSGANNLDGGAAASVYLSVTEELNGGGA